LLLNREITGTPPLPLGEATATSAGVNLAYLGFGCWSKQNTIVVKHGDIRNLDYTYYNDLYEYNKGIFKYIEVEGEIPCKRAGPSIIYHSNSVYLFGGYTTVNETEDAFVPYPRNFNDIYKCKLPKICANITCMREENKEKFKLCGACGKVAYCSVECQRLDWNAGHKQDCKKVFTN